MHCNLRLPVVLDFNCEAHNALAYKFNNTARLISAIGEHLSVFWAKFVLCMHRNCFLRFQKKF